MTTPSVDKNVAVLVKQSCGSPVNTRWASTFTATSPTPASPTTQPRAATDAEDILDGIYVLRTSVPAADLDLARGGRRL